MAVANREPNIEYLNRLKWSLFFRIVIVSIILVSVVGFHLHEERAFFIPNLIALYFLVGFSYFLTLISLLLIKRIRRPILHGYLQVFWEVIFASGLIYLTGLWESFFALLYVLAIIIASILLFRNGAFFSATLSAVLYGVLVFGVKYHFLPSYFTPDEVPEAVELLQRYFYYLFAFFASAVLSTFLAEQIRRTHKELDEARIDLTKLEALNEAIVHSINSGLVILNPLEKVVFINPVAEKLLEKNKSEILGKTLNEIFGEQIEKLKEIEEAQSMRIIHQTSNKELILDCSWHRLKTPNGDYLGKLVVINDITQLEQMHQKLRVADRLAVVGQLAAGIAHEIRNPLAAISGSVQLLKKELTLESSQAKLMDIVLQEAERLNKLITDFLLYARPTPKSIEEIKLDALFTDLARMAMLNHPQIKLALSLEKDIIVYSDPRLIEQIFWNLVNNAIEAMDGKGELKISAGKGIKDSQKGVWFEVADSGCGIAKEHLSKIFDPFFTTKEHGSGLGLSTVWRIVQELGGEIQVNSELGRGTKFYIWLPEHPQKVREAEN